MHKFKFFLALAFFWTVSITYLSLTSSLHLAEEISIPNKDKMAHFVFYFLFVVLWSSAINPYSLKNGIKILIVAISYGILMEIFQKLFTTTRTADVLDALANSIGAIFGLIFTVKFIKK